MVRFVPASRAHVGRLARRMRAIDQLECRAKGRDPAHALRYSLASSQFAVTAMLDGSPHAMFGVTPYSLSDSVGRPWFLGSDEVFRHGRLMLEHGNRVVSLMHGSFRRLENVIATRNARGIRLLRRWGFEIGNDTQLFGGVEFVSFWRTV